MKTEREREGAAWRFGPGCQTNWCWHDLAIICCPCFPLFCPLQFSHIFAVRIWPGAQGTARERQGIAVWMMESMGIMGIPLLKLTRIMECQRDLNTVYLCLFEVLFPWFVIRNKFRNMLRNLQPWLFHCPSLSMFVHIHICWYMHGFVVWFCNVAFDPFEHSTQTYVGAFCPDSFHLPAATLTVAAGQKAVPCGFAAAAVQAGWAEEGEAKKGSMLTRLVLFSAVFSVCLVDSQEDSVGC